MTGSVDQVADSLSPEHIEAFLKKNPTFLLEREQLLSDLYLPHATGGSTVSLVEKQVNLLRERNIDSRKKLSQFVNQAKANDELFRKTQVLVLAMLDSTHLKDLIKQFNRCALEQFSIDAVQIQLMESQFEEVNQLQKLDESAIAGPLSWVNSIQNSISGVFRDEELALLFPKNKGVESAIVLPIRKGKQLMAILCFGSHDSRYFDADMDTLFIEFVASVLARQLVRLK